MAELETICRRVEPVVREAGEELRRIFRQRRARLLRPKEYADFQLSLDPQTEKLLKNRLARDYPRIPFRGEEKIVPGRAPKKYWLVDPVDGSSHLMRGIPIFTISLSLVVNGESVLGLVYNPVADMLWRAVQGGGSFLNNKKIHVSPQDTLAGSHLYVDFPERKYKTQKTFGESWAKKLRQIEGLAAAAANVESHRIASWALALVASGGFDAYVDFSGSTKPWDVSAGIIIVKEAGGQIYDMAADAGIKSVVATNGKIDKALLGVLIS